MTLSDRIKAEVSLVAVAERAGVVWDRGKSRPARGDMWAPCPFHNERTASFHVVEPGGAGGWFRCFGCGAKGSVVDFVMERDGLDAAAAIKALASGHGIDGDECPAARRRREAERAKREAKARAAAEAKARRGLAAARAIWRAAAQAQAGDVLHRYLESRGVNLSAIGGVPPSLRLHPALAHRCARTREVLHTGPAMVGWIGRDRFRGVHRTWITEGGRARLPGGAVAPKQWLGATGAMFGHPVRLTAPGPRIIVGEGIETTLAALSMCMEAGDARWSAEAALARDAMAGAWTPPPGAVGVMVLGEGSAKDPAAAEAKGRAAKSRLESLGVRVALRVPGGRWDVEMDYADVAAARLGRG
ncbi:CHC2 zinc finger domain-containing protein [Oceanicella actignis]|uniref:CHC2 zinc finger n=1 Tax=Oceanicella actignis TaxID=1189325 RepID=A0A1M7U1V0_9RHOB|nr:CHC2 zinc finger domain-containing protein [Oceanicella actignis]SES76279.1 CHC2 zinc finger [Oceanicella actignis]SHN77011.1 CHC2 zinc finger [Oceanicella actignis]